MRSKTGAFVVRPERSQFADLTFLLHLHLPPGVLVLYRLPTKGGEWRVRRMSPQRLRQWVTAWAKWWAKQGRRLAISPEMWE